MQNGIVVDQQNWPLVKVRFGSPFENAERQRESEIKYLQELARMMNSRAKEDDKPWILFDIDMDLMEASTLISGPFVKIQTEFCKEYHERMQNLCSGFVIVIRSWAIRAMTKYMTDLFPSKLLLHYASSNDAAMKLLQQQCKANDGAASGGGAERA